MFTGIIQGLARVVGVQKAKKSQVLTLSGGLTTKTIQLGESIAVNGCCLTVFKKNRGQLFFDLSEETLRRTTLGGLVQNQLVHVERALTVGDHLGGHFVQGHVDTIGTVKGKKTTKDMTEMTFSYPKAYSTYLIDKGSIAVDGVSLTACKPTASRFKVYLVPHTLAHTTFGSQKVGSQVNLEFDLLAKYVEKQVS